MELTPEQLHHIAELARLRLTAEEEKALSQDISQVLEYVDMISGLELPQQPLHSAIAPSQWRPDNSETSLPREEVLDNAPRTEADQIIVPPVLPGGEEDA